MAWNPKYKIDLLAVFKRAYSGELASKLRPILSDTDFKLLYGQRVVDKIVERTLANKDRNGDSLGSYSKIYKDSLIFKIYKGKEQKVNLRLTGDMLASLNHSNARYTITVDIEGQENRDKAQGHISGVYGKSRTQKRDFLGVPPDMEVSIMKATIRDYRNDSLAVQSELGLAS